MSSCSKAIPAVFSVSPEHAGETQLRVRVLKKRVPVKGIYGKIVSDFYTDKEGAAWQIQR